MTGRKQLKEIVTLPQQLQSVLAKVPLCLETNQLTVFTSFQVSIAANEGAVLLRESPFQLHGVVLFRIKTATVVGL